MGKTIKIIKDNIDLILKDDKKRKIILIIGFLLILIIFISGILPDKPKKEKINNDVYKEENDSLKEYENSVEEEIYNLIKHIDGVGRIKVMVTLETSQEILYQFDSKTQVNQNSQDTQQQVVIVEDENGNKKALVKSKKLPKIKGIVVVCDGADDIDVQCRVVDALTTAFDIGSSKVSVVLHSKTEN